MKGAYKMSKKYTCDEVKEKFIEAGYSDDESESMLNVIEVEYNNLERNGICKMEGKKLRIPNWDEFLFEIHAYNDACGPYTQKDIKMARRNATWNNICYMNVQDEILKAIKGV